MEILNYFSYDYLIIELKPKKKKKEEKKCERNEGLVEGSGGNGQYSKS